MTKILGLDLGTNSLGWAVVETGNDQPFSLIDKGVRIFQEGVKIEKGIEGSKAAARTEFRSSRRNKYRRRLRKIATLKVLSENGYCPKLSQKELDAWRYQKIYPASEPFRNWLRTDELQKKTPYYFRHIAVTEKLDLVDRANTFLLGRAFYHLAQRRGFLSNRLDSTNEKEGAVLKSINEISQLKGDKTLGQYFFEKYTKGEKIRDAYTHREDHYLDEFYRICKFQKIPLDVETALRKAIFYQRPLKSQKGLIGKCVYEPDKQRCSVSRPEFEEFRMLSFVNNIKIKTNADEKLRPLNLDERDKIIPLFFRKSKPHFDFEEIAKQLAPKKQYKYFKTSNKYPEDWLFNYSMKTTVSGCPATAKIKEVFGDNIYDLSIDYIREKDGKTSVIDINDIWHVLYTYDSEKKLGFFAQNRLHLEEEMACKFQKIKLRNEYSSLSLKAIKKILPFLREGLIYSHAVFLANMDEVLPGEIWSNKENRVIISNAIIDLIRTQNEEKQIVDVVNGLIKRNRENNNTWSEEAKELFLNDLQGRIESTFGKLVYSGFSKEKCVRIESRASGLFEEQMKKNMGRGEFARMERVDERIVKFLGDNFDLDITVSKKLYHPSAIEVYKDPKRGEDGRIYLGSPMVSSIKNPMAMRAMHQLRRVINELISNGTIDSSTKIHIEMSRGLLNANERKALQSWQRENEEKHKKCSAKIIELNGGAKPSIDDILKYQLWEEQNHKCIYTGREIKPSSFLGADPEFDIEHTIPRSQSFDNSQVNKTLCEASFNRSVKRNKIPTQLVNHAEILPRIEHWKVKYEELNNQINFAVWRARKASDKGVKDKAIQKRHELTFERNYYRDKYIRFLMEDVPEGFRNSQIVDTGIITKYSRLYLKTMFDKVYTVKGNTVADFRKLWGLQAEYEKKERVNHIHHCIDAITIACITKENYENLAKFYHDWEGYRIKGVDQLPKVEKPWNTFTEDIINLEKEILVSHYTPDVLPKQNRTKLRRRGKIQRNTKGDIIYQQGDTVRGGLHEQFFYGAIARNDINKKGEIENQIKYVRRVPVDSLSEANILNIVDDRIREIITNARKSEKLLKKQIEDLEKKLKQAEENEEQVLRLEIESLKKIISELYTLPNKNGNPVPIKKVRIYYPTVKNPLHVKKQRDVSKGNRKPYKEDYHVVNEGNYLMAIYEGKDSKGKLKRDFELINNLEAGSFFKYSAHKDLKAQGISGVDSLIPYTKEIIGGVLRFKAILKIGTMVILWNESPVQVWDLSAEDLNKRLYKVVGLSEQVIQGKYHFGTITLLHNQEARPTKDLKVMDGAFSMNEPYMARRKMNHNQFNALVEGVDFRVTPLGKIVKIEMEK